MPTSIVDNKKTVEESKLIVEEGDVIEGAAKKVNAHTTPNRESNDMIEGDDKKTGMMVGFQREAIMGCTEGGETIKFTLERSLQVLLGFTLERSLQVLLGFFC
jgi:hypothetical protein